MFSLDRTNRVLHEAVGIRAFRAIEALLVHVDDREKRDGGDAEIDHLGQLGQQQVDTLTLDAGHRLDWFRAAFAIEDEDGVDKIARPEVGLGHETAQRGRPAATPEANLRELTVTG